ncbi:hypothetical protein ACF0H5_003626 [Mactra antiquata]
MPNKTPSSDENGPTRKRSERLRSKHVDSGSDNDQSGTMSLDVLAHVASETLRKDTKSPGGKDRSSQKKVSIRNAGSLDCLTLHQILGLTERTILNLFTETTSNELSRTFTYTCQLMPKTCHKQFSSFGSEMKARVEIKKHIYDHLNELEEEARTSKTKFTAEPVPARNRRLLALNSPKRGFVKRKKPATPAASESAIIKTKVVNDTILISDPCLRSKRSTVGFIPDPEKLQIMDISEDRLKTQPDHEPPLKKSLLSGCKELNIDSAELNKKLSSIIHNKDIQEDPERHKIEENEQFIIELLSKTQPHHDHCYTTIFGGRSNSESVDKMLKNLDDDQPEENKKTWFEELNLPKDKEVSFYISDDSSHGKGSRPAPILFLRHRSPDENVPMVSAEEIIDEDTDDENNDSASDVDMINTNISSGEKPYPPMPKSVLAKKGRLGFDYHDLVDADEFVKLKKKNPLSREGREGNLGWEPKLALRYIKELKGRSKNENIPLKCKICNDKFFTATATLMYHYRSHAGIKPFVCLICNTTFTRQHSLNYHMLIHNNQSRFTCKDCGRKFRHPSHFKEHLRRHTGETPFHCLDCGQRFKTRNTYKRHLKTRHGKLLTASGISMLSEEEFAKVRTRKYQIPKLPEIGYKMPELTFTKLKRQQAIAANKALELNNAMDVSEEDSMILEELKADIKKENESGNESDPELVDILEALQQTSSPRQVNENEIKEEPGMEVVPRRVPEPKRRQPPAATRRQPGEAARRQQADRKGVYVNNINKEIGEALLGINV